MQIASANAVDTGIGAGLPCAAQSSGPAAGALGMVAAPGFADGLQALLADIGEQDAVVHGAPLDTALAAQVAASQTNTAEAGAPVKTPPPRQPVAQTCVKAIPILKRASPLTPSSPTAVRLSSTPAAAAIASHRGKIMKADPTESLDRASHIKPSAVEDPVVPVPLDACVAPIAAQPTAELRNAAGVPALRVSNDPSVLQASLMERDPITGGNRVKAATSELGPSQPESAAAQHPSALTSAENLLTSPSVASAGGVSVHPLAPNLQFAPDLHATSTTTELRPLILSPNTARRGEGSPSLSSSLKAVSRPVAQMPISDPASVRSPSQLTAAAIDPLRETIGQPSPGLNSTTSPLTPPALPADREAFTALDSATAGPQTTWIHTSAHHAEAGYLDPSLGWVSVRADASSTGLHAAIVPSSPEAASALSSHLAGLNAHLAEQHGHSATVSLASESVGSNVSHFHNSMSGEQNSQKDRNSDRQVETTAIPVSHQTNSAGATSLAKSSLPIPTRNGSGVYLSVMA